jgi:hypothetical protein
MTFHDSCYKEVPADVGGFYKLVREQWLNWVAYDALDPNDSERRFLIRDAMREHNVIGSFLKEEGGGLGLEWHFKAMLKLKPEGAALDAFLMSVAELVYVSWILSRTRFQWHPGNGSGPQFGEWEHEASVMAKFAFIASGEAKRIADECAEWAEIDNAKK